MRRAAVGPLDLTAREFELLEYLLRHQGHVVSREMLARDVWKEPRRATPIDNVIDVQMARLRKKVDVEGARAADSHAFAASDSCCERANHEAAWAAPSIRARLTGWYALVLTVMLIVYATATFVAVRHEFLEQLDDQLHDDFETAEGLLTRTAGRARRVDWRSPSRP